MYRRLQGFLERNAASESLGLVGQAMGFCIQGTPARHVLASRPWVAPHAALVVVADELTDYFRLLAVLEAQINQSPAAQRGQDGQQQGASATAPAGLTLRRLVVWTQDPLHRMRLLASLVESVQGLRGGALASAVHAHTAHGDSFVASLCVQRCAGACCVAVSPQSLVACPGATHRDVHACWLCRRRYRKLLQRLCTPLFAMIQGWVVAGELSDEHGEFFVVADPTVPDAMLWHSKYHLNHAMLPTFIGEELGQRILLIGKSINFIRHCCGDKEWVMDDAATVFAGGRLQFGDDHLQRLREITKLAYESANKRLVSILFDKYKLLTHCRALKRYLLLGQGDFVQYLMTGLGSELDLAASRQYHHNLVAVMDSALRSSNAQFEEKEVIDRLDIKVACAWCPCCRVYCLSRGWAGLGCAAYASLRGRRRLGCVCTHVQGGHPGECGAYTRCDGPLPAHLQLPVAVEARGVQPVQHLVPPHDCHTHAEGVWCSGVVCGVLVPRT